MSTQNELLFSDSTFNWNYYTHFIKKVARKFLGTKFNDWVEDATQEALVKIIVNQNKFNQKNGVLEAWIYTITKNICLDIMSKKGNDPFCKVDVNESFTIISYDEDLFEKEENIQLIENAISKLVRDSDSKQKMVDGISRLIEQLKKEPIESQKVIEELEKIRFDGL